jgi:pimeloyl-ACP methyl ester carboxylesterase
MKLVLRIGAVVLAILLLLVVGGYVSLLRPDIPYARLEAKYAGPASRFIDLPGGLHVHYRDQGDRTGPAVVMVHGFSASLHAWEPWVARLGGQYRIVTLDLPGHGLTRAPAGYRPTTTGYADMVDAVARRLDLGPYVVVGNSMGGAVAWEDALRHRDDVRALVLVDAAGWPEERRRRGGAPTIFRVLSSPVGRILVRDLDTRSMAADGLRDAYLDPSLVTPALVDRYVELSRAPGHRDILLSIVTRGAGKETRATFKTIAVPTLVMHGMDDRLVPYTDGQAFAATIPGARLVSYPGVGHVPMEQIPDRSAADLKAFLDSLPPPAPKA